MVPDVTGSFQLFINKCAGSVKIEFMGYVWSKALSRGLCRQRFNYVKRVRTVDNFNVHKQV